MDPEKRRRGRRIFDDVLEQKVEDLQAFLARECSDDSELLKYVQDLVTAHFNPNGFLAPLPDGETSTDLSASALQNKLWETRRFKVVGKLGRGGFGDVYEAFDADAKRSVALKVLRDSDAEHLGRFKNEFRTLSDISHRNIIHVFRLFSDDEPPFFTMRLLKGCDFRQYLQRLSSQLLFPEQAASARACLRGHLFQLATGLERLHRDGLVHRDLKPSNVFLTDDDDVVVLDLGLVKQLTSLNGAGTRVIAGTPDYIAPEQLGGSDVTQAADWYAFGVLLFESLTGRKPFEGDVPQVLDNKRTLEPPRASSLDPTVPADLDELCHRLMQRAPEARPRAREVLEALDVASAPKSPDMAAALDGSSRVFLGRDQHIRRLHAAFEEISHEKNVCVHVYGASGVGKTAVVESFLNDLLHRPESECVVLHGRCYQNQNARHKGLDELVDRLAVFLKNVEARRRQSLLPKNFDLLTPLFPVLRQIDVSTRISPKARDPRVQRQRAFVCLRELLRRIVDIGPLVLWIDDLHWSDAATVRFLNDIVRMPDPFGCLIILSYRDNDLATNRALSQLQRPLDGDHDQGAVRSLRIENFAQDDARSLAKALLERNPRGQHLIEAVEKIASESTGNPFIITELVKYVIAAADGVELNASTFGIKDVIKRRVRVLPDATTRLLEFVAVAGQPISSKACESFEGAPAQYQESQGTLTREQLLRITDGPYGQYLDVYHDQIREAIVAYLPDDVIPVYHRLIGRALESSGSKDDERLSIHFENAGLRDEAIEHAKRAAQDAESALAFERAVLLYERLLKLIDKDAQDRDTLRERLGNALANAGRGKDAAEIFIELSVSADPIRRLDLRRRACEHYLRGGHTATGLQLTRSLLADVGIRFPERKEAILASLLWYRLRLSWWFTRHGYEPATRQLTPAMQTLLDTTWMCALGMSMVDVMRGAVFQAQYTLLALQSGDACRVALGLAAELALGGLDGQRSAKKTKSLFDAAMKFAKQDQKPYAIALTTSMMGVASYNNGDFSDCLDRNTEASKKFAAECVGADWEYTTASCFALSSMFMLGRWNEHAKRFPRVVQQAEARGDRHGAISLPLIGYTYVHSLIADRPDDAHAMIARSLKEWHTGDFQMQHCDALLGELESHLYKGNGEQALETLDRHWPAVKKSKLLEIRFYEVMLLALKTRAMLMLAVRSDATRTKADNRPIANAARRLIAMDQPWTKGFGSLLHAGNATVRRNSGDAVKYLRAAEVSFATARMEQFKAVVLYRLSQIAEGFEDEREEAVDWMKDQGVVNPGRMADALAPGRWE
jgi:eukaryotic-like serine/threonine-protein kinase